MQKQRERERNEMTKKFKLHFELEMDNVKSCSQHLGAAIIITRREKEQENEEVKEEQEQYVGDERYIITST